MSEDAINPKHYKGIFKLKDNETIAVSRQLDFCMGNYYKYLARLYKKDDPVQDFHKARWYAGDWLSHHLKTNDRGWIYNECAEKAVIAFDFIEPPEPNTELWDRYKLMSIVTAPYINPEHWISMLNRYEKKYLSKGDAQ